MHDIYTREYGLKDLFTVTWEVLRKRCLPVLLIYCSLLGTLLISLSLVQNGNKIVVNFFQAGIVLLQGCFVLGLFHCILYSVVNAYLRGEVLAFNELRKKSLSTFPRVLFSRLVRAILMVICGVIMGLVGYLLSVLLKLLPIHFPANFANICCISLVVVSLLVIGVYYLFTDIMSLYGYTSYSGWKVFHFLKQSRELVCGRWWRVFLYLALTVLGQGIFYITAYLGLFSFANFSSRVFDFVSPSVAHLVVRIIFSILSGALNYCYLIFFIVFAMNLLATKKDKNRVITTLST